MPNVSCIPKSQGLYDHKVDDSFSLPRWSSENTFRCQFIEFSYFTSLKSFWSVKMCSARIRSSWFVDQLLRQKRNSPTPTPAGWNTFTVEGSAVICHHVIVNQNQCHFFISLQSQFAILCVCNFLGEKCSYLTCHKNKLVRCNMNWSYAFYGACHHFSLFLEHKLIIIRVYNDDWH